MNDDKNGAVLMKEQEQLQFSKVLEYTVIRPVPAVLDPPPALPGATPRSQNTSQNFFIILTDGTNVELVNK